MKCACRSPGISSRSRPEDDRPRHKGRCESGYDLADGGRSALQNLERMSFFWKTRIFSLAILRQQTGVHWIAKGKPIAEDSREHALVAAAGLIANELLMSPLA